MTLEFKMDRIVAADRRNPTNQIVILAAVVLLVCMLTAPVVAASIEHTLRIIDAGDVQSSSMQAADPDRTVSVNNSNFDLTYGADLAANPLAQAAFDRAAAAWSTYLSDSVTVKLDLDYAPLGAGILGSTSTTVLYSDYTEVRDLVSNNAGETNNAREASLLPNLPNVNQFSVALPAGFGYDGSMTVSQANYHALGGTGFTGADGAITFSSDFGWDFDSSDGIDSGKFDFEGVATHEIGHALGFISDVDYVDVVAANGETAQDVWPTTLDLFRFKMADVLDSEFDFTETTRNMIPGEDHVLYYGDGMVPLASGAYTGDGNQASHFKDNLGIGIMDPTAAPGELLGISINDLIALDLIGWDVDFTVPEPATVLLMSIGAIAALVKKRKCC